MNMNKLQTIKITLMIFAVLLTLASVSAIDYEIKFNKNTYELADTIKLTVEPDNLSAENMSIDLTYQKIHPEIEYEPQTIKVTTNKNITINKAGTYKISTSLINESDNNLINNTTSTNLNNDEFTIKTFDLDIDVDKTILPKNNDLKLTAKTSNAQSPINYKWTFNDGTGTNKEGESVIHNFPKTGTHTVLLEAEDSEGNINNATQTITVQDAKIIWIEVRSEATKELIENAEVDFGTTSAKTDNLGRALFYLPVRTYILEVNKDKFRQTRQYIDVTKDNTYVIYLNKDREEYNPPAIVADTLLKDTINKESTILKYEVYDENPVRCEVYLKRKDTNWKFINSAEVMGDTKVYTAEFDNLKETRYDWRIDCEDSHGNQESVNSHFTVDFDAKTSKEILDELNSDKDNDNDESNDSENDGLDVDYKKETGSFLDEIESAKENFESSNEIEKSIIKLLEINTQLNIGEKDVKRWEESLYRLANEDSREEYDKKLEEVKNDINVRKDETIKAFKVTSNKELSKENSDQLFAQQYKNSGKDKSKTDITTRVVVIQAETFSDETEYYTFVFHEGFDEEELLAVNIPSNVAESRSEIKTKNSLSQVKDMTLEFTPVENSIVYFIEKSLDISDFDDYELVVLSAPSKSTSATGRSISFSSENFQSTLLFVLIGALTVFYVVYNFELVDKIKDSDLLSNYKGSGVVKDMKREIKSAKQNLNEDVALAEKTYTDLMIKYQSLTRDEKHEIYNDAMSLHSDIVETKIDKLQDLIEACLYRDDPHSAKVHLNEMEQIYNGLPADMKDKLKYKTILANFNVKNN